MVEGKTSSFVLYILIRKNKYEKKKELFLVIDHVVSPDVASFSACAEEML